MSLTNDDHSNAALLNKAFELGINFYDTADIYQEGANEITLGKFLKGKREKVTIATKGGNQLREGGKGWDWNPRKEYLLTAIDKSLRRLGTDYIDLYQLHGGTMEDPIDETIEVFESLLKSGKIRFYGISSIRPQVIREYARRSNIVSVMMQYSLLDRRPEESSLSHLHELNIGVLARGTLAKGLLVNKDAAEYLDYSPEQVDHAARVVSSLTNPARTASHVAIGFVLRHPAVTSAVAGIRTREHLSDLGSFDTSSSLTPQEAAILRLSLPVNYYKDHR